MARPKKTAEVKMKEDIAQVQVAKAEVVEEEKPVEEKIETVVAEEEKPVVRKKRASRKKSEETEIKEPETTAVEKKPAEKKEELNVNLYVEYDGKQFSEKDMIEDVKRIWVESGHRVSSLKSLDLYVNTDQNKVYYVINKETKIETGDVELRPVQREE